MFFYSILKNLYYKYLIRVVELTKMLEKFLKILKNLFIKFKKSFINILNAICLLFLFYNAIDMTFDYMSFSYSYKLIVDDNKESFNLPDISVCTENKILFAKNKIKHYFNIEYDVKMYGIEVKNFVESETYHERDTCTKDEDEFIDEFEGRKLKWRLNFRFNLYYRKYQRFVFNEMSFYEMNSLTFEANELFDCSANIPIEQNPIDLNVTQLDNCFDRFRVTKSIYANKELGICYRGVAFHKNSFHKSCVSQKLRFTKTRFTKVAFHKNSFHKVAFHKNSFHKNSFHKNSFHKKLI